MVLHRSSNGTNGRFRDKLVGVIVVILVLLLVILVLLVILLVLVVSVLVVLVILVILLVNYDDVTISIIIISSSSTGKLLY